MECVHNQLVTNGYWKLIQAVAPFIHENIPTSKLIRKQLRCTQTNDESCSENNILDLEGNFPQMFIIIQRLA